MANTNNPNPGPNQPGAQVAVQTNQPAQQAAQPAAPAPAPNPATQKLVADPVVTKLLAGMNIQDSPTAPLPAPLIVDKFQVNDKATDAKSRMLSALAALLFNVKPVPSDDQSSLRFDKGEVQKVVDKIEAKVNAQINEILHNSTFQEMERSWRGLQDLVDNTNFKANITIDMLDVAKDELDQDFENNSSNIFSSALFNKVYIHEYDQYGGQPFGAMIGLYDFSSKPADIKWLTGMGKVANAAHCPFISAVSHEFFNFKSLEEMEAVKDLEGHLTDPRFDKWNNFRDTEEAAYIGLTFPRYVLRLPWNHDTNPVAKLDFFDEVSAGESQNYLFGNSAILFARNLAKAFENSGWCQSIRGVKGGGLVKGLPRDKFRLRGQDLIQPPVEVAIPDYREWEFAKSGFIPLVYKKESADATFFSSQSAKLPKRFKDPKDSENSQLVANLAYTFSITRLAHYIKSIMRDNIGSTANEGYIADQLTSWLSGYVTTVVNPDDLTVRRFPFKAAKVVVTKKVGEIGWYDCTVSVLPHIQFEGLNTELLLESRLG